MVTEPAQEHRQETPDAATTQELASRAKEQVQEKSEQLKGQATDRLREQVNEQSGRLGDRILGDLEDFARRRPWVVGAVATTAGFVASRFLMASSQRRYEGRYPSAQPSRPSQPGWEEPR